MSRRREKVEKPSDSGASLLRLSQARDKNLRARLKLEECSDPSMRGTPGFFPEWVLGKRGQDSAVHTEMEFECVRPHLRTCPHN